MSNLDLTILLDKKSIEYETCEKTAKIVSIGIGGYAKFIIYPHTVEQLIYVLQCIHGEKFVIIGNGTNTYFSDGFYNGIVIVTSKIKGIFLEDGMLCACCGESCKQVCIKACQLGLSGLEFAYGIPGCVGGAVAMNAAAFNSSFSDIVYISKIYDVLNDKICQIDNTEHKFSSKNSIFRNSQYVLLQTRFYLKSLVKKSKIINLMESYDIHRKKTQPLDMPSAGSTFVRPKNGHASYMIDACNLKGFSIGGAEVSVKHAGFIINKGNATSFDIRTLISVIRERVHKKFNVNLKEEIIYLE